MVTPIIDLRQRKKRATLPPNAYQRKVLGLGWALMDALHSHAKPIWKAKLRQQDSRLDEDLSVELGPDLQLRIRDSEGRIVAVSTAHRRRAVPSDHPWNRW
jgi:hypothetical protein